MRRCMLVVLAAVLAACGSDSTGPEPYQGRPCQADVDATINRLGQPTSMDRGGSSDAIAMSGGSLYYVSGSDTTVYTFTPHYDDTYWCEVAVQLP